MASHSSYTTSNAKSQNTWDNMATVVIRARPYERDESRLIVLTCLSFSGEWLLGLFCALSSNLGLFVCVRLTCWLNGVDLLF